MASFIDDFLLLDSSLTKFLLPDIERRRTISVHEINKRRSSEGEYHHLFQQPKGHPDRFYAYTRMNQSTFDYILKTIECKFKETWCNWHKPILPEERLVVTLRFLITVTSFKSLAFSFRMGPATVAGIVSETVDLLWEELQPVHMTVPTHALLKKSPVKCGTSGTFHNALEHWTENTFEFGAPRTRDLCFTVMSIFFSIVLQDLVDANYRLIVIDVGGYGKHSDGGTFQASSLYQAIMSGTLQIPEPTTLHDSNDVTPFVIVADEAYPLMHCLLKPYGGQNLPPDEDCFNKRLSRSRKTVECAFGILTSKWRLLTKPIETHAELVDRIIKCICVLHNVIIDKEGINHNYTEVSCENSAIVWERGGRPSNDAKSTRDIFKKFFNSHPLVYTNRQ